MIRPTLFTLLPEEYVCTPDSMTIDGKGDLILSCPNYADPNMSGCVVRIDKQKRISKWFDVPTRIGGAVRRPASRAVCSASALTKRVTSWKAA